MSKYFRPALFILAALLIWSTFNGNKDVESLDDVVLSADTKIAIGTVVEVEISNNSEEAITLPANCPSSPLPVERYTNGEWEVLSADSEECVDEEIVIEPDSSGILSYAPWNAALFSEKGRYRVSLNTELGETEKTYTREIEVGSRSVFRMAWQEAFYKPIFNTLIYFIGIVPGNSLGWAIILLTLVIKMVLLVPNQKALKAQKAMQKIQPQLDALKVKYKGDQQKLAEETMKIWQKHKVSPMGSCLPMLIQFPVLIALFYVVKDGLDVINTQLLYPGLVNFDATIINSNFLNIIDLTQVNIVVLPLLIGGLQFTQMKLSIGKSLQKKTEGAANGMPNMNKTMMYFMPVMIAVFTASLPAAVGFYWGTSTLFGIIQQIFVNKSKD